MSDGLASVKTLKQRINMKNLNTSVVGGFNTSLHMMSKKASSPIWEEISVEVSEMKKLPTYNMPVKTDEPSTLGFIDSLTAEDRLKYHLDISIDVLSDKGCTPSGVLKKTAGMEREDLLEWILSNKVKGKGKV
jgi:hypothetical protein